MIIQCQSCYYDKSVISPDGSFLAVSVMEPFYHTGSYPIYNIVTKTYLQIWNLENKSSLPMFQYELPPSANSTFPPEYFINMQVSGDSSHLVMVGNLRIVVFQRDATGTTFKKKWEGTGSGAGSPFVSYTVISDDGSALVYNYEQTVLLQWSDSAGVYINTWAGDVFAPQWRAGSVTMGQYSGANFFVVGWTRNDFLQNQVQLYDIDSIGKVHLRWTWLSPVSSSVLHLSNYVTALATSGRHFVMTSSGDCNGVADNTTAPQVMVRVRACMFARRRVGR